MHGFWSAFTKIWQALLVFCKQVKCCLEKWVREAATTSTVWGWRMKNSNIHCESKKVIVNDDCEGSLQAESTAIYNGFGRCKSACTLQSLQNHKRKKRKKKKKEPSPFGIAQAYCSGLAI